MLVRRSDHSEELLNRAIAATRQLPLPDGPSEEIAAQTLAALREAGQRPEITLLQRVRHMPWSSKAIAVLATAASLLVVYVGLSSFGGKALAFADVAKMLNEVRTATWKTTTEIKEGRKNKPDEHPGTAGSEGEERRITTAKPSSFVTVSGIVAPSGTGMFLAPSHERTETTWQGIQQIHIVDGEKNKTLILTPATKVALLVQYENLPSPVGRTFLNLRKLVADSLRDDAKGVERLGVRTIGGRPAQGFRIKSRIGEMRIWADPKTSLPVRVEEVHTNPDGSEVRTVMSDFQTNIDLDKSLFSLEIPKGYSIQPTLKLDYAKNPISHLAHTLKMVSELNEGVFPAALTIEEIDHLMKRGQQLIIERDGLNSLEAVVEWSVEISSSLSFTKDFLNNLTAEKNDWHYAGKGVKLNTPDRPVFWYRDDKESKTYHVLYADLSVKEVPAAEAPKAPQAVENSKP
jgi:outer membrane lipoprotein-sorting protein